MDYLSGVAANLSIKFGAGKEPVVPDVGSVTYTLLDHAGVAITGQVEVPVTTTTTSWRANIVVPMGANTVATGKGFERRTIVLSYQVGSVPFLQQYQYRLSPYLNFSVTPDEVRSFIGVNEKELEDSSIDLLAAYLFVEDAFGNTSLSDLMSTGTLAELNANEAIRMKAVLDVLPSVKARIAQTETNGVIGFSRPKITDFDALAVEAQARYAAALATATNSVEVVETFVFVTTDADPITG